MSRRLWITDFVFYLIAPIVVAAIACALWMATTGAMENYRLGLAFDQSIRVVEIAREMHVAKGSAADRAADDLIKRLAERGIAQGEPQGTSFLGQANPRAYLSPWETPVQVFFYPESGTFRLETEVSASVCRRLLGLYAKGLEPLGIWRIHLSLPRPGSIWRLIYERSKDAGNLSSQAIDLSCSMENSTILSLLFFLKGPPSAEGLN